METDTLLASLHNIYTLHMGIYTEYIYIFTLYMDTDTLLAPVQRIYTHAIHTHTHTQTHTDTHTIYTSRSLSRSPFSTFETGRRVP
jgi:hypothetical protein